MLPWLQPPLDGRTLHFGAANSLFWIGELPRLDVDLEQCKRVCGLGARADAKLGEDGGDVMVDMAVLRASRAISTSTSVAESPSVDPLSANCTGE